MFEYNRIQELLSERPGQKILGARLAAMAGVTLQVFQKRIKKMIERELVCRVKLRETTCPFYRYYMTPKQIYIFKLRKALAEAVKADDAAITVDTDLISDRLSFLRMLREQTVYGEHVALQRIIEDYERTKKMRQAIEETFG